MQHAEAADSALRRVFISDLLNAIRLGLMFDAQPLLCSARAQLGSLLLRSGSDLKLQESVLDTIQSACEILEMAGELDSLRELSKKPGQSPNSSQFASAPRSSLRKDLSRMLESRGVLKLADVTVVFRAAAGPASRVGMDTSSSSSSTATTTTGLTEMRVHSSVLYARSAYFRSLLGGRFGTDDQLTLEAGPMADAIPSFDARKFLESLVGIFYGRDDYTPSSVSEALLLLDRLHFYGLDDEAQYRAHHVILESINAQNCLQIFKLVVDVPGLDAVRRAALAMVCSNMAALYCELEKEKDQYILNKILLFKASFF